MSLRSRRAQPAMSQEKRLQVAARLWKLSSQGAFRIWIDGDRIHIASAAGDPDHREPISWEEADRMTSPDLPL